MNAAELYLKPVSSSASACEWVRQYFKYEGLPFNSAVEDAVSRLLGSGQFGWFFELMVQGEAIGYAVLTRAFDHEIGGEYAILTDFFLLEPHRRQGYGSRALKLLETFAQSQGAHAIDLYVLNRNAAVRKFYHRHGFRDVEDRRPMTKSLSEPDPKIAS
jgi:GNAT superfamily N-acetyltransferase